jgi:hypothetical protein
MIDENPLKQYLKKQPESQFVISKYSLAFFSTVLGSICLTILAKSQSECGSYRNCLVFLALYHFIDCMTYIHQGFTASVENDSLEGWLEDGDGLLAWIYQNSQRKKKFDGRDVIYTGNKNSSEHGKAMELIYPAHPFIKMVSYMVFFLNVTVFIYVQFSLFGS